MKKGICLPVRRDLVAEVWIPDRNWWLRYLDFLVGYGYTFLVFWDFSFLADLRSMPEELVRYTQWISGETRRRNMTPFIFTHWKNIDQLERRLETFPSFSYMLECRPGKPQEDFEDWLRLFSEKGGPSPCLIARGYKSTPEHIARARNLFLRQFPDGEFWVTRKFSEEHFAGTHPIPDFPLFSKAAGGNLISWFQVCSDFDPFRFTGAEHIRACLRNSYDAGARGFLFMPPHWWSFPLGFDKLHPGDSWTKDALWYGTFGLYEGQPEAEKLPAPLRRAGEVYAQFFPTLSEMFWFSADFQYHPPLAVNFSEFVPDTVYADMPPRLREYPSIADQIAQAQAEGRVSDLLTVQQRVLAKQAAGIGAALGTLDATESDRRSADNECFHLDVEAAHHLACFWSAYSDFITRKYCYVASGSPEYLESARGDLKRMTAGYERAAAIMTRHYDADYILGIWNKPIRSADILTGFLDYAAEAEKRLKWIPDTEVLLGGKLLDEGTGRRRCISLEWPFVINRVSYLPVFRIIPFSLSPQTKPSAAKLFVVCRYARYLEPFREQLLSWVQSGGHLLFYCIEDNSSLGHFLPFPAEIGPAIAGSFSPEDTASEISRDTQYLEGMACEGIPFEHLDQAWEVRASLMEKPVVVETRLGKGAIAFCQIRLQEWHVDGDIPPVLTFKSSIDTIITRNWLGWSVIIPGQEGKEKNHDQD